MENKDFPDFDNSPAMGCPIGAIEMKHRVRLFAALPLFWHSQVLQKQVFVAAVAATHVDLEL